MSTPSDSDQWTLVSRKGRRSQNPTSDSPVFREGKCRRTSGSSCCVPVVGVGRLTLQGQQPADPVVTMLSEPLVCGNGPAPQPDGPGTIQGQGQQPAGSGSSSKSSLYDDNFPPLTIKRGGWDIPPGHGLFGGQPTNRNLFGLKPDEIKAALEDSPPRDPATPSAGPSSQPPAATPPAAPTAGPQSPSAVVCKHCIEAKQHKCSQCGLIRCRQFHLNLVDEDKRTFICKGCDPTVMGLEGLSTMWRMPQPTPQGKKRKSVTTSTPPSSPPPSPRRKRVQWSPSETAISGGLPSPSAPAGPAGPSRADR